MIESPQSFVVREECEKAASQNGFRRVLGEEAGWRAFSSTTAQGIIYLAAGSANGPWYFAVGHAGAIAELEPRSGGLQGPGKARYVCVTLRELYAKLDRVYSLGVSLPDAPLREFECRVANLPRMTEAERLVVPRIGQDIFSRPSNGLLAGPRSANRHHRCSATSCLPHHPLGGMRDRCGPARRAQRVAPLSAVGRCIRPCACDHRRSRQTRILADSQRTRT